MPSAVLPFSGYLLPLPRFADVIEHGVFVWRKYAIEAWQLGSRSGHQGGKPGHEIQWLEGDMGSTFSIRRLQLVMNVAV